MSIYLNSPTSPVAAVYPQCAPYLVDKAAHLQRPSGTLVFIEKEDESKKGSSLVFFPAPSNEWVSYPAERHGLACNATFADGHVDTWTWRWTKKGGMNQPKPAANGQGLVDLRMVQATVPR